MTSATGEGSLQTVGEAAATGAVKLFLAGDVMTGRGIDQVLPHPGSPCLHERYVRDARRYVALAEEAHGPLPRPVDFSYVWGDALAELAREAPDARIVNLETSVTRSDDFSPGKEIHYRMHPDNAPCLGAARLDCCVIANNHVLDFGRDGLLETLDVLVRAEIATAGAGRDRSQADRPAVLELRGKGRVIVSGLGSPTSGIPASWSAAEDRAGVAFLEDLSEASAARVARTARENARPGDVRVVSIHWGGNWGYEVPEGHVRFARALIRAGIDVVHGHSSHHVRPIEVFDGKLILYGCGDFLHDYEGITGYERFRGDLALIYFASVRPESGRLASLRMVPMQVRRFRLNRASRADAGWLREVLVRESRRFGVAVDLGRDGLELRLPPSATGRGIS